VPTPGPARVHQRYDVCLTGPFHPRKIWISVVPSRSSTVPRDSPRRLFRSVTTITRRSGQPGSVRAPRQHAPRSCLQDSPGPVDTKLCSSNYHAGDSSADAACVSSSTALVPRGLLRVQRQMKLGLSPSVPGLSTPRFARDHRPGDVAMAVTRAATLLRETSVPLNGSPFWVTS